MINNDEKIDSDPQLLEYLQEFLTERRKKLIEEILAQRTRHLTVVLEDVWHSQNASAVVRSCECFGIQSLNVIENSARFKANTNVVQGAAKWIDIERWNKKDVNNTQFCFDELRRKGYAIAATTLRKEKYTPIGDIPMDKKIAVCFGCEETGLSDYAHDNADDFIQLPMYGFTESFNISVSVALVLQKFSDRLRQGDIPMELSEKEKSDIRMDWTRKSLKNCNLLIKRYMRENS